MTVRVSLAVVQDARKLAFDAAGNNIVILHKQADKDAGLPPTRKLDPRVQKAISFYAGCSHTLTLPSGLTTEQRDLARRAVLGAMADKKARFASRVHQRLCSADERQAGEVTFESLRKGNAQRTLPIVMAERPNTGAVKKAKAGVDA